MRTLTQALTLTSIATAVRAGFRGALDGLSAATKAALVHLGGGRRALKTYPADGPIVRVRRSTDNAEADIGSLRNGAIDAAAAATFAGAGDLFVVSSYDQSGAGRDLAQSTATAQPKLMIMPPGGRRNLLTESLSYKAWVFNHSTSPSSTDISSDGDIVGWEIPVGATGFNQRNYTIGAAPAPRSYFWSVIVEARDPSTAVISFSTNGFFGLPGNIASDAIYTFATGVFVGSNPQVIDLGGGRVRLVQRFDLPANASGVFVMRVDSQAATNGNVIFRGAQLEVGALTDYQRVDAGGMIVYEQGSTHTALMLFDGSSDYLQRPMIDFPGNMVLLPATGPNFVTGDSATFDGGVGSWLVAGSQGTLTASGGVAQITGINNYGSKAFLNMSGLAGKSVLFELDVWTSGGPAYIQIQRADAPFTEYASTYIGDPTPRRIQLYLQSGSWTSVNLAISPWAGSTSQVVYFDNISVRELDPNADTGVTVAMRIKPESNAVSSIWSMRSVFTGYLDFGRNADGTLRLGYSSNAGTTASGSTTTPVALGNSAVVVARWDFVTRSGSIRIDGVGQTVLSNLEITSGLNPIPYLVGATNTGSVTNFFGGLITGPIVFKSHVSDAECQIIEQALGATP